MNSKIKNNFDNIKKDVDSGETLAVIAKKWGVSRSTLSNYFKSKATSHKQNSHPKYSFDINYFEKINSPTKAYLLGYLFADGCVLSNGVLRVHCKDKYFCELLKKELRATHPIREIYRRNKGIFYELQIQHPKLLKDLSLHGIVPNKTELSKTLPRVLKKLTRHMLRGFFDGDGTVFKNKDTKRPDVGFTGMFPIISDLQKMLEKHSFFVGRQVVKPKTGNACKLYGMRKKNVTRFYNFLYKDAKNYLPRKKLKFERD